VETALIICRFLHFSAAMLLFGSSTFTAWVAPAQLGASLQKQVSVANAALLLAISITAICWLCLETGLIGDSWTDAINPGALASVLTGTSFGNVWSAHLTLTLLPALALRLRGRGRSVGLALSSGLVLASLGFVGHAADEDGPVGLAHRLNHALHLLSSGFWLGCLPPLLAVLARLRNASHDAAAAQALARFSGLGHIAVALALATGVVNTALVLHHLPTDFSSPYQLLLAIKIALVALMLMVALFNRYVAVPQLSASGWVQRGIVMGTIIEIAIGATVIALVSAFATMDPSGML
jgi:putative copper resistance protein D